MKSMLLLCVMAVVPASAQESWFPEQGVHDLGVQKIVAELKTREQAAKPAAAAAAIHDFSCVTESSIEGANPARRNRGVTRFSFAVLNLEAGDIRYFVAKDSEDPVKMDPKDSALDLNENGEIYRVDKTNDIKLRSDSDGILYTTVVLYADKGYKAGYVRIAPDSRRSGEGYGVKAAYSKVNCQVRKRP